jgi:RNA polymerase sigma-70 factor, ECF subfamily
VSDRQELTTEQFSRRLLQEQAVLSRYALRLTRDRDQADDLVQDCLARALEKRGLYTADSNLRGWLCTLMRNLFISNRRSEAKRGLVALDETDMPAVRAPQLDHMRLLEMGQALGRLSPEQSAVIMLIGVEGLRYHQAARRLGIPIGTVRSRLARGRVALAGELAAGGHGARPATWRGSPVAATMRHAASA